MRRFVFGRRSWLLLGTVAFLAAAAFGRTQEQLAAKEDLKRAFDASDARLKELISGAEAATKADQKHADAAARWYLYRFTIRYYVTPTPAQPNPVDKLHKEFEFKVFDLMRKDHVKNNAEFRKLLGVSLVDSMKSVLGTRDLKNEPSTIIHVAQMLPDVARLKQDEVSAYLCELAKDDKNPVVQLYAIKALKETMPVVVQPDPDDFAGVNQHNARKSRDIKNVDTLRQFIERPVNTAGMSPEEVKGVIFLRREAIISLAQAGSPAVVAMTNKKKAAPPEGVAAHTLLNVLAGTLSPPATVQEKVEAALGLCSMKYANMPEYEPQVAIYFIAKALDEFVADYAKDRVNFSAGKKLPYMAFIGDARRWQAGLKELSANTPAPHAKATKDLDAAAAPILASIIGTAKEKYQQPDLGRVNELKALVSRLRPKTETAYIFKTLKIAAIPLGK